MTVSELIAELQKMPGDLEANVYYGGRNGEMLKVLGINYQYAHIDKTSTMNIEVAFNEFYGVDGSKTNR